MPWCSSCGLRKTPADIMKCEILFWQKSEAGTSVGEASTSGECQRGSQSCALWCGGLGGNKCYWTWLTLTFSRDIKSVSSYKRVWNINPSHPYNVHHLKKKKISEVNGSDLKWDCYVLASPGTKKEVWGGGGACIGSSLLPSAKPRLLSLQVQWTVHFYKYKRVCALVRWGGEGPLHSKMQRQGKSREGGGTNRALSSSKLFIGVN